MSRVAKRYAKALFELAEEQKVLDQVYADLLAVAKTVKDSDELQTLLLNPLVNERDKLKVLDRIFSKGFQQLTGTFLDLLADKRRLSVLREIVDKFHRMMLAHNNQVEVQLISAVDLDRPAVEKITKQIQQIIGKEVLVNERIEPSIIGGFVVKVEDIVIDNSIRSQLNKLREQLTTR